MKYNYFDPLTFENIKSTWDDVRKSFKNKNQKLKYLLHQNTNNYNIYKKLLEESYTPYKFNMFLIFRPKVRLVMSSTISDKIVNHFVAKYYLVSNLEPKLIDSNVATRKNKGTKYANKLVVDYLNTLRIKYPKREIYVLKVDISKYFYSINHEILINKLKRDLHDKKIVGLINKIISETNKDYINKKIRALNTKHNTNIPLYKKGVGLSIGAMTSQFLAIYYLNDLDHYLKETLKCRYYIRYMDDFLILDVDKERLKYIWKVINEKLTLLKLTMNPKSNIFCLSNSFSFLGYKYYVENNKLKVFYKKKNLKNIVKKLKTLKSHDLVCYYKTLASYHGYLSKLKRKEGNFTMTLKEKYEYYHKHNLKKIILIKEGSFYKTLGDSAKIVWNLFRYKLNQGKVAFGVNYSSKVFDKLKEQGLGYVVVDNVDKLIVVDGFSKVYDLNLELASINYHEYLKKKELEEMFNKVIIKHKDKYDFIKNFFIEILNS